MVLGRAVAKAGWSDSLCGGRTAERVKWGKISVETSRVGAAIGPGAGSPTAEAANPARQK